MTETENSIDSHGEWQEDSLGGGFKRFAKTPEDSTWVCNQCGAEDADPYEDGCPCCGADADM